MRLNIRVISCGSLACLCLIHGHVQATVTFDWSTVGNPGNAVDPNYGFGAVAHTFRLSKYEVTNDQYTQFLNAVDPMGTNPNSVYHSDMGSDPRGGITFEMLATPGSNYASKTNMGNKPVNYVTFYDSMRFVNWLENGQPTDGTGTETGVYTVSDGLTETRAPGATYFLPNEDEWHKAAYHQPAAQGGDTDDYWLYPTATSPTTATANATGDISNPGTAVANYLRSADWNGQNGNVTTVGTAGPGSASFYGTFDLAGNVSEWNDSIVDSRYRGNRGGHWDSPSTTFFAASFQGIALPRAESDSIGFRVASIPEPSSLLLAALGGLALMSTRRPTSVR